LRLALKPKKSRLKSIHPTCNSQVNDADPAQVEPGISLSSRKRFVEMFGMGVEISHQVITEESLTVEKVDEDKDKSRSY
jgi:hypothetical protein